MFWAELRYCVLSRPCRSPLEDMMSGTRFQRLIQVGKPGVLQSIPELSRWKVLNLIKSLQASEHSTILFLMVMFVQLVPPGYTPWFLLPPHRTVKACRKHPRNKWCPQLYLLVGPHPPVRLISTIKYPTIPTSIQLVSFRSTFVYISHMSTSLDDILEYFNFMS